MKNVRLRTKLASLFAVAFYVLASAANGITTEGNGALQGLSFAWLNTDIGNAALSKDATANDNPALDSSDEPITAGNWRQALFNAAHTGNNRFEAQLNRNNVGSLTELWVSQVGVGALYSSPVVSEGKVYIGSGDGRMYAFDALTGATVWVGEQQSLFFVNSAAAAHGMVFANALFSQLKAYDAETGEIVWMFDGAFRASPTLSGNALYVGDTTGTLYAVDAATGTLLWSSIPQGENHGIDNQAPTVYGDRIYQPRGGATNNQARVWVHDKTTGDILASAGYGIVVSVSAARGKVFVPDPPTLYALDPTTDSVIWSAPLANEGSTNSTPTVAGGLVFVAQSAGLQAFDAQSGALVWIVPTAAGTQSPVVANGVVYSPSVNGEWDAYDARNGTLLWSVITASCSGQCINGTAAVVNGILYLAGPDNFLRAYTVQSR